MKKILLVLLALIMLLISFNTLAISVGQEGRLYSGGEAVPVAISKEALDEYWQVRRTGDTYGLGWLLVSGKILAPRKGTKVLIIDTGIFVKKVRILEGEYSGMSGWVPMEYVK